MEDCAGCFIARSGLQVINITFFHISGARCKRSWETQRCIYKREMKYFCKYIVLAVLTS